LASGEARRTKNKQIKANEPIGLKPKQNEQVNVKDIDNDKDINIPALSDFQIYALSKKPNVNIDALKLKYESWIENGWKDGNDKNIKNWKTKLLNTLPHIKEDPKKEVLKVNLTDTRNIR